MATQKTTKRGASSYRRLVIRSLSTGNTTTTNSSTDISWDDTFTGAELKNWREIIRRGGNATTNADGHRRVEKYPMVFMSGTQYSGSNPINQLSVSGFASSAPVRAADLSNFNVNSMDLAARISFMKKARASRTAFQGGVFLGELREAISMIRHPAQSLRRGIDDYYRTVKKRANVAANAPGSSKQRDRAVRRAVSGTWLEYQYGWRPLISDIEQGFQALSGREFIHREVISSTNSVDVEGQVGRAGGSANILAWEYQYRRKSTISVRYKGAIDGRVHAPAGHLEHWGLSLNNWVPTIWELIPYSFLVDYFSNIGQLIDGASLGRVSLAWGCRTIRRESTVTSYPPEKGGSLSPSLRNVSVTGGEIVYSQRTSFSRRDIQSVGVSFGDFRFQVPDLGSTKWLNISALAGMRR